MRIITQKLWNSQPLRSSYRPSSSMDRCFGISTRSSREKPNRISSDGSSIRSRQSVSSSRATSSGVSRRSCSHSLSRSLNSSSSSSHFAMDSLGSIVWSRSISGSRWFHLFFGRSRVIARIWWHFSGLRNVESQYQFSQPIHLSRLWGLLRYSRSSTDILRQKTHSLGSSGGSQGLYHSSPWPHIPTRISSIRPISWWRILRSGSSASGKNLDSDSSTSSIVSSGSWVATGVGRSKNRKI